MPFMSNISHKTLQFVLLLEFRIVKEEIAQDISCLVSD